jgi:hypothetical protein
MTKDGILLMNPSAGVISFASLVRGIRYRELKDYRLREWNGDSRKEKKTRRGSAIMTNKNALRTRDTREAAQRAGIRTNCCRAAWALN